MPDWGFIAADGDAKQSLNDAKKALKDSWGLKVSFDFLIRERISRFFKSLADERNVPSLECGQGQFSLCEFADVGEVAFCKGPGAAGHISQKGDHLFGRLGHLRL